MANYGADQIIELEFMEAVRLRPGMYIGNNNIHGLHHLLLEVLDNAVDECISGFAKNISISISKNGTVSIKDNGRGIPVEYKSDSKMSALTQVMVKPHAGGKFGGSDSAYSSSGGLHGIGLKCTNAYSSQLSAEVYRYGLTFKQQFENGGTPATDVEIIDSHHNVIGCIDQSTQLVLSKRGIATHLLLSSKKIPIESDPLLKSGTLIRFRPNRAWFSKEMDWPDPKNNVPWSVEILDSRFRQIAHLFPGVRIEFTDHRAPDAQTVSYFSSKGLVDYISYLNEDLDPLHKTILFSDKTNIDVDGTPSTIETEVALQYAGEETQIYSFANAICTPLGGTHVTAFKAGLTKAIKQFATQKKLIKGDDDFRGDDVLLGLTAIIKLTMSNTPQFLSQTKESLTSPEVHGPVFSTTYNMMTEYLEKNIPVGKIIVNQAIAASRGREAAAQARKLVIKKSAMEAGEFVLGKLADIQRRGGSAVVPLEYTALYLVEGDSAGGSCKQGRDSRYHAILPLRGKIPNVEKMKLNAILQNREIASIVAAVGTGVGSDCDIQTIRYGRITVLVDADVDGSHIATLLATLFWRTMRSIIEQGKFFIARPPLYMVRNEKNKQYQYAYSDQERDEIITSWNKDNVTFQRYKGLGEMNPEQLRETVFVIPEIPPKRKVENGLALPAETPLSASDFSKKDLLMVIDDVHRTRSLIERLMGTDVGPRKEWLMNTDWSEEE